MREKMSFVYSVIFLSGLVIGGLIVFLICKCKRKMKIIMLSGNKDTGKTITLKKVYKNLSNNKKPRHYKEIENADKNEKEKDLECYPLFHRDKKVALYTAGDVWDYIKEAIIDFDKMGADVLIIAFSEDKIKEDMEKDKFKESKIFRQRCVIPKKSSLDPNDPKVNEENNEEYYKAIIKKI